MRKNLDLFRDNPRRLSTGYFGIPGRTTRGAVHIVNAKGKPICGTRLSDRAEFQWCARWVVVKYIECRSCLKWWAKKETK